MKWTVCSSRHFLCFYVTLYMSLILSLCLLSLLLADGTWPRQELLRVFCHLCFLLMNLVKVFQDEETGKDAVFEMWMISELHTDVTVLSICFLSLFNSTEHWGHSPMTVPLVRRSCYLGIVLRTCVFCVKLRLFFSSSFFPRWISFAILLAMSYSLPAVLSKQFTCSTDDLVFIIFSTSSGLKSMEPGADL